MVCRATDATRPRSHLSDMRCRDITELMNVPAKFRRDLSDLLQFEPIPWADDAMCKDMDTEVFFGITEPRVLRVICNACPVKAECLDYAVRNLEFGFWGGKSEEERKSLRREHSIPMR